MVQYFVKNRKVHKHPVPSNCKVSYDGQTLHAMVASTYEKCDDCWSKLPS